MTTIFDLQTPALIVDCDALDRNLATMAAARPGAALRPHVKAHKCTALAAAQFSHGHYFLHVRNFARGAGDGTGRAR